MFDRETGVRSDLTMGRCFSVRDVPHRGMYMAAKSPMEMAAYHQTLVGITPDSVCVQMPTIKAAAE